MKGTQYFVSGIDTDCGKTFITGLLARNYGAEGKSVITTKLIQTGCKGISEDIKEHRRIMGIELLPEDLDSSTCSHVFSFPSSPHLAAKIDNIKIDLSKLKTPNNLIQKYDVILTEGAGGLMVPITTNYLNIDYIKGNNLPLIFVSSSKLGSINHTMLSLAAIKQYGINLHTFIFNLMPNNDETIAEDSFNYFKNYLKEHFPQTKVLHSQDLIT